MNTSSRAGDSSIPASIQSGAARPRSSLERDAGVGVNVESGGIPTEYPRIISLVVDGPAHRDGALRVEDNILSIDGESCKGWTITRLKEAILGRPDTTLRVTAWRRRPGAAPPPPPAAASDAAAAAAAAAVGDPAHGELIETVLRRQPSSAYMKPGENPLLITSAPSASPSPSPQPQAPNSGGGGGSGGGSSGGGAGGGAGGGSAWGHGGSSNGGGGGGGGAGRGFDPQKNPEHTSPVQPQAYVLVATDDVEVENPQYSRPPWSPDLIPRPAAIDPATAAAAAAAAAAWNEAARQEALAAAAREVEDLRGRLAAAENRIRVAQAAQQQAVGLEQYCTSLQQQVQMQRTQTEECRQQLEAVDKAMAAAELARAEAVRREQQAIVTITAKEEERKAAMANCPLLQTAPRLEATFLNQELKKYRDQCGDLTNKVARAKAELAARAAEESKIKGMLAQLKMLDGHRLRALLGADGVM